MTIQVTCTRADATTGTAAMANPTADFAVGGDAATQAITGVPNTDDFVVGTSYNLTIAPE